MSSFKRNFFLREPLTVASELLGATLTTESPEGRCSGIIVEAEAYGSADPASHSFRGLSKRNSAMFSNGGYCYVYLVYGMYYCVNVVTEKQGVGSAVLIRAVVPQQGIELMQRRRGLENIYKLCSGPAKVCQAFGIDLKWNNHDLLASTEIFLTPTESAKKAQIVFSERIGISRAVDKKWRVSIADSKFLSRKAVLKS